MLRFIRKLFNALRPDDKARHAKRHSTRYFRPALEGLEERAMLSAAYVQTNLVSNVAGLARIYDQYLVDPWDVNFPQLPGINPPVVVADQGSGVATSYQISSDGLTVTESSSPVTIPTVGSSEPSGPTGLVQNTDPQGFKIPGPEKGTPAVSASYIFDTLQGTIGGFAVNNPDTSPLQITDPAQIMVKNGSAGAEYTGLATGTFDGKDYIYAANEGTNPGIQVFNSSFQRVPLGPGPIGVVTFGNFIDPILPKGFMPYGVRDLSLGAGSKQDADLFVTYRGPNYQGGAVAEFTNDGTFVRQLGSDTTSNGNLQSPWGLAYVNGGFGEFSGDLLVGNFSSGQIDAYNLPLGRNPTYEVVDNTSGTPLTIPGLRSIHFGPGLGDYGSTHVGLLFTAVGNSNYSLYGEITPAAYPIPAPPHGEGGGGGEGMGGGGGGGGGNHLIQVPSEQDGTSTYSVQAGTTFGIVAEIDYSSMASVELNDSSAGGSSYCISGMSAGTSYTINAGFGADALDVVSPILQVFGANLDAIAGPLPINGGGANNLTVDSEQDGTSN